MSKPLKPIRATLLTSGGAAIGPALEITPEAKEIEFGPFGQAFFFQKVRVTFDAGETRDLPLPDMEIVHLVKGETLTIARPEDITP